jgi:hypothetical protein
VFKTYYPQRGGCGYTRAIIAIVVFVTLVVSFRTLADESIHRSSGGPSVGTLLEEHLKSLPYMCECEFYRGPINGETMVFATRNERAVGFAVVDGQLMTLQRDGRPAGTLCRKNARYHERWVSSTTAIVLDQRVIGSGAESCWYNGKLHVTVDGRMASIPISGACGC